MGNRIITLKKALLLGCAFVPLFCFAQRSESDYLREVLGNLERVKAATYLIENESYMPGDTIPSRYPRRMCEADNPADTTIGASFLWLSPDSLRFQAGYDGQVYASVEWEDKTVVIDDFTTRKLPFRLVSPPFFSYAKNIIRYALTTTDRIETKSEENDEEYHFQLTINEENQVEFFGKAFHIPASDLCWDPISRYELWIRKEEGLPYRIRRQMMHQTTVETVSEVTLSQDSVQVCLADYFPEGFAIHKKGDPQLPRPTVDILDKPAPDWTLDDADANPVSLGDFKGRVLLINFTGIGCGACHAAIPFLRELKERFPATDFDLVSIETWGRPSHSLKVYTTVNKLNYKLLHGEDAVTKTYLPDSAVPVFILLDQQRVVRRIFHGYAKGNTDEQIIQAIGELLQADR